MIKNRVVREIQRAQKNATSKLEPRRDFVRGFIVRFDGSIRVPGHPTKVWFSELGMPESIVPVTNRTVQDVENLPVIVGWETNQLNEDRVVIGVDTTSVEIITLGEGGNVGQYALPNHAQTHEWRSETDKGSDPIRIWSPALRPGKTLYDGGNLGISIYPLNYMWNGQVVSYPGTGFDLEDYLPSPGKRYYIMTAIDKENNEGVLIIGNEAGIFDLPSIPELPPNHIPSALFLLNSTDTGVNPSFYRDLRPWIGDDLPAPTAPGQFLYSADGVRFRPESPVVNDAGWIMNDLGYFIVKG